MLFPKGQFILYFHLLMLFTASFGYILVPMKRDLPSHREKCQAANPYWPESPLKVDCPQGSYMNSCGEKTCIQGLNENCRNHLTGDILQCVTGAFCCHTRNNDYLCISSEDQSTIQCQVKNLPPRQPLHRWRPNDI